MGIMQASLIVVEVSSRLLIDQAWCMFDFVPKIAEPIVTPPPLPNLIMRGELVGKFVHRIIQVPKSSVSVLIRT